MKKRVLSRILCLFLCLTAVPSAFAASEESTITVSLSQLAPGFYLGAVWDGDELLTMFDYTVGSDGKLETNVEVGKVFPQGKDLTVGVSGANAGGTSIPPIICKVGADTSDVPSQPTTPAEPDKTKYYKIYFPSNITGGSISVSHTYAAPGTVIYINVYEETDYELQELYVVDGEGDSVKLTKHSTDQYSFAMPAEAVDIYADFEKIYYSSSGSGYGYGTIITPNSISVPQQKTGIAQWRYSNGLIYDSAGVTASEMPFTRGMLLSILFNADGQTADDPILWAMKTGVIGDYRGAGLSGSDKNISWDQMAYILHNFAKSKGYSYPVQTSLYSEFAHPCTREAFAWANAAGLFHNQVNPREQVNVIQASTALKMFFEKVTH